MMRDRTLLSALVYHKVMNEYRSFNDSRSDRLTGEWFKAEASLLNYISQLE